MAWTKQQSQVFTFENAGDEIIGILKDKTPGSFEKDNYTITTDAGDDMLIFGTTVLNNRMRTVAVGKKVKIVYTGEEPPKVRGNHPTKIFEVYVDE